MSLQRRDLLVFAAALPLGAQRRGHHQVLRQRQSLCVLRKSLGRVAVDVA